MFCPSCGEATPTEISRDNAIRHAPEMESDEAEYRIRLQRALGEDYELRKLIGCGGFGAVYAVWDVKLDREVAVKALRHDLFPSPDLLESCCKLDCFSSWSTEDVDFFVMESINSTASV